MVTDLCPGGFFSDSQLFLVGASCLSDMRQWERVHSSVMRLTCGSITKVLMSFLFFLDGEVTAADSFYHQGAVGEIPLKTHSI